MGICVKQNWKLVGIYKRRFMAISKQCHNIALTLCCHEEEKLKNQMGIMKTLKHVTSVGLVTPAEGPICSSTGEL